MRLTSMSSVFFFFFFQAEDGIRDLIVTGVQTCALPISPAPFPIVIGNGQEGESYGAELTGDYRISGRWRVRAGYTELRVHIWASPGSTDTTRGSAESHDPERQFIVATSADLPAQLRLGGVLRYVASITNQQVPDYAELNARLTWQPTRTLGLSLVGQNLLHDRHAEFGTGATRREIERGVFGGVGWHL